MKRMYALLLVSVFAGFLSHVYGQTQPKGGSVADVSFIQGNWKATTADGRTIDGVWLAPENGNILGFMRMMKGGKADLYEILAYEQSPQGLVSLVKHFQPGLVGTEEKDKQDRYNFVEASKDKAIFQKEGEDLRILYEKRSPNQFVIARGNQQDGKWVFKDLFVFNRAK
ncbi:hypothetical protein AHMF7605_18020 [Adhaeribacter arboris]|uniref:DUF6265 domain-containing protein n=1 Tax=Adhaeribacter arboris TaxID=2072846 RepID=A0A2T2YIE4_9BACT|nr:DUF6265 family protein [Adhaeribacter arboris]PSR55265.1 hypothetical protein AHMF7605_18020 [Adhaeribacter arboris]